MKYMGMATQMAITILVFVLAGKYADEYFQLQKPYITLVLTLIGLVAALWLVLKDFINPKE